MPPYYLYRVRKKTQIVKSKNQPITQEWDADFLIVGLWVGWTVGQLTTLTDDRRRKNGKIAKW
jgi:hypothetical protein